ncbi:MAG TPA: FecR family protein [Terriglobales bacterium]|nr:FecR family protein [Terriglobales bacterium]
MDTLRRLIAGVLCLLLSPIPAVCAPPAGGQHAGQISALIPAATKNDKATKAKDDLDWNDLLKTTASGRLRAGLDDGSILSVGSNSELRVVQHDAASQQTSLEMGVGRLRSKVVKITQPNGKFEVHTPNAVIGVIGTDFYVGYEANKTTVICYTGLLSVTPLGSAKASKSDSSSNASNSLNVAAGQMVEITTEVPPGGYQAQTTPSDVQRASMDSTEVPDLPPAAIAATHPWHWALLFGGFMAVATGLVFAVDRGTTKPPAQQPTSGCPVGVPPSQCN